METTSLTDLARRVGDDLSVLAKDHLELARVELSHTVKSGVADGGAIVLGGVVALVGFGMLCVTVVAALAAVIPALWLRLLLMAIVYLLVGGGLAAGFAKRLRGQMTLGDARTQTKRSAIAIKEQVTHGW